MRPGFMEILSVGIATAAMIVAGFHSGGGSKRARASDLPGGAGACRRRSGTSSDGSGEPERGPDEGVDRPADDEAHNVPAPPAGNTYDPRPQDDKARRRITYLLIAFLVLLVMTLVALVAFGVITVGDIREFDLIIVPVVTLASGATGYYFATGRK